MTSKQKQIVSVLGLGAVVLLCLLGIFWSMGEADAQGMINTGPVSTVSVSSPLTGNGTGGSPVACGTATGSVPGCISAADWTTFNAKQATVSFASIGSTPSAKGCDISSGVVTCEPADGTHGGMVAASGDQTLGISPTFTGADGVTATANFISNRTGTQFSCSDTSHLCQLSSAGAGGIQLVSSTSGSPFYLTLGATDVVHATASSFSWPSGVDLTVGSAHNKGQITLNGASPAVGTATVVSGCTPICTANDAAADSATKCAVSTTTLTATGPNGSTGKINWVCL